MSEQKTLHSIHALRFIAAFAVLVHHVMPVFGSKIWVGATGVDIFFVISGVVIGMSMVRQEPPYAFAMKRFIRVMPFYWVATAAYILVKYLTWHELPTTDELVRSALLWPRFGTGWVAIYFLAWTLTYEMLFYLSASVALVFSRSHAWAVTLVVLTLIGLFHIPVPGAAEGTYFHTAILLEFCAGLAAAPLIARGWRPAKPVAIGMLIVGVTMLWINQGDVILINDKADVFHLTRPLSLGIPSALVVFGMLGFESAAWMRSSLIKLGGDASYAIYVTHLTTIIAFVLPLAKMGISDKEYPISIGLTMIVLSLIVGIAAHLFIERPLLSGARRLLLRTPRHEAAAA